MGQIRWPSPIYGVLLPPLMGYFFTWWHTATYCGLTPSMVGYHHQGGIPPHKVAYGHLRWYMTTYG